MSKYTPPVVVKPETNTRSGSIDPRELLRQGQTIQFKPLFLAYYPPESSNYKYIDTQQNWDTIPSMDNHLEEITMKAIENMITELFRSLPQVTAISASQEPEISIFNVFTSNLAYDDPLMDRLLDIEMEILGKYPDRLISIHYRTFSPEHHAQPIISEGNERIIYKST